MLIFGIGAKWLNFLFVGINDAPNSGGRTKAIDVVIVVIIAFEDILNEHGSIIRENDIFSDEEGPASNRPFEGG